MSLDSLVVNDVTRLNPVKVFSIARPESVEAVQDAVRRAGGPISVGGGRFSMGGQTASPDSLHLDMRRMNRIVAFAPVERVVRVEPGVRWCDLQQFLDGHDLSVKIMQTYANFTVGGSLSVNCHGRYIGLGPLVLSVRSIRIVTADGECREASPSQAPELFHGAIGGYGGLGVIVEAELEVSANERVERSSRKMKASEYLGWFRQKIRPSADILFHNGDLYPPDYERIRAVSWTRTERGVTTADRLQPVRRRYLLEKYFFWAFTETPLGRWRREHLVDPLLFRKRLVHWRNYEAGYSVEELEPRSRAHSTYVLQEYFVPIDRFDDFRRAAAEILQRHRVNVVNISVRHALADPGTLLAWAREEVFAFVLYYKQRTRESARTRVAVWTRELIQAAIDLGGAYYLPYQAHATAEQFHAAYPRARELFALKARLDPDFRFRNVIWDTYYPEERRLREPASDDSEFLSVFASVEGHDGLYRFLQTVFNLYPEDRLHALIREAMALHGEDEAIYRHVQEHLGEVSARFGLFTHALPTLLRQKRVLRDQTLELLGAARRVDGYLEIGSTGRYWAALRGQVEFSGPLLFMNDLAPTRSPVDIIDRGGRLSPVGTFLPLDGYPPLTAAQVPDASLDLVTCYIGLHHCPLDLLDEFIGSIVRVLRPGGRFVLRDHDCTTEERARFVSLIHTVFNAGTDVPWESNAAELRRFRPVDEWIAMLAGHGLAHTGPRLAQHNDPSDNLLLCFVKDAAA